MKDAIINFVAENGTGIAFTAYFMGCITLCVFLYALSKKPDTDED